MTRDSDVNYTAAILDIQTIPSELISDYGCNLPFLSVLFQIFILFCFNPMFFFWPFFEEVFKIFKICISALCNFRGWWLF